MEKELFIRASEALSNLENRVFLLEYNNGAEWGDNRSNTVNKAFVSFEKLVEYTTTHLPKYKMIVREHIKEEKPLEESYSVRFERKKYEHELERAKKKYKELNIKWYGRVGNDEPTEEYLNLTKKQQMEIQQDIYEVQSIIKKEEEEELSSYKMIIAELY